MAERRLSSSFPSYCLLSQTHNRGPKKGERARKNNHHRNGLIVPWLFANHLVKEERAVMASRSVPLVCVSAFSCLTGMERCSFVFVCNEKPPFSLFATKMVVLNFGGRSILQLTTKKRNENERNYRETKFHAYEPVSIKIGWLLWCLYVRSKDDQTFPY